MFSGNKDENDDILTFYQVEHGEYWIIKLLRRLYLLLAKFAPFPDAFNPNNLAVPYWKKGL